MSYDFIGIDAVTLASFMMPRCVILLHTKRVSFIHPDIKMFAYAFATGQIRLTGFK